MGKQMGGNGCPWAGNGKGNGHRWEKKQMGLDMGDMGWAMEAIVTMGSIMGYRSHYVSHKQGYGQGSP
jgi:hypothetical protein